MSDVNRKLRQRNDGKTDFQCNAAGADTEGDASEALTDDRALQNDTDQLMNDDVARSAANQNSRAYDASCPMEAGSGGATDSSDSSGDDADYDRQQQQRRQNVQVCGPDRVFCTSGTASIPYRALGGNGNDDEDGDDEDSNGEDGDDDENSDGNSGGGFGQFGYSKNNQGDGYRPGYGGASCRTASNGYSMASSVVKDKSARGSTAAAAASTAAAGGANASNSEKIRQKSGSSPEQAGSKDAGGSAKAAHRQQQQQQRSSHGHSSVDSDPGEPKAVHYSQFQYGQDPAGVGPASDRAAKGKGRKRREQGVRATIKAQDVKGNRGNEDIDKLLDFIENNPSARSKKSIAPKSSFVQPQLQLPQHTKPKKHHKEANSKSASSDSQPKSQPSPPTTAEESPAVVEQTSVEPKPPQAEEQEKPSAPKSAENDDKKSSPPSEPPVPNSVDAAASSGAANGSAEPPTGKQKQQLDITDFDNLAEQEAVQEDAFSVVRSKKDRKRQTKRNETPTAPAFLAAPPKHKPRQADSHGSHTQQPHHPASSHQHQQHQHRQATSAHSASTRAHNGSGGGHSAAFAAAVAAAAPSPAGPSPPTSGQTPASTVRTSSSSRSGSPGASDSTAAAATANSAAAAAPPQRRPRPLNPAKYEKLLRQKAEENALLRRDLDSCSPNHSQLISFLYSLC